MIEGFEVRKLGDLCEVITKGTTPTSVGHKFQDEGINFVKVESITANGTFINSKFAHITVEGHEALKRSQLKTGDILFSIAGALGRTAMVTTDILPANTNQALSIIRLKADENIFKDYVFYALSTGFALEQIEKHKGGVAQQNLSLTQMKSFELPIPPLSEQKQIVALLDKAFEAIDKAKANIEQNIINAKELFQSLLLKKFLLGIEENKWDIGKLSKYNQVVVGYVGPISKAYTDSEEGVLLLSTKNVSDKGISLKKLTRVERDFHLKYKKSQLTSGDILVSRHGKSGEASVIPDDIKEAHALNVIIIKESKELSSEYIAYLLNSGVLESITESKTGSIQEIINTSVIKNLLVPVPDKLTQEVLVDELKTLHLDTERLINKYEQKVGNLEELKKSILQKAFRGELTQAVVDKEQVQLKKG